MLREVRRHACARNTRGMPEAVCATNSPDSRVRAPLTSRVAVPVIRHVIVAGRPSYAMSPYSLKLPSPHKPRQDVGQISCTDCHPGYLSRWRSHCRHVLIVSGEFVKDQHPRFLCLVEKQLVLGHMYIGVAPIHTPYISLAAWIARPRPMCPLCTLSDALNWR